MMHASARETPVDCPKRHAGADRTQVLRTAALQFALKGLRGTTMRTLAEAAGVSESTLYIQFEYSAELYRNEMGAIEIVWDRALAERVPDPDSRRILSVHLVPYAVSSCLVRSRITKGLATRRCSRCSYMRA
jgi:AcrR family transcriptional regulator